MLINPTLTKGSLELLILSILEEGELYGYEITKRIEDRSGFRLRFRRSSIYPVLGRMEKKEWVVRRWTNGGRKRCYFTLTEDGSRALDLQRAEWKEFTRAVNSVIEDPSSAWIP